MSVDLNKKLRYNYHNGLYAEEVGRYNDPKDYEFCVIFRGDGHKETNSTTKKVFIRFPNSQTNDGKNLENYPEVVPWNFQDIKVDAWYRRKTKDASSKDASSVVKISYLNAVYNEICFLPSTVIRLQNFAEFEYTLDHPLDPNSKWLPCTKEVAK